MLRVKTFNYAVLLPANQGKTSRVQNIKELVSLNVKPSNSSAKTY